MALPFSTPPSRIESGDLYHVALHGYRLDLVVDLLKYVVSLAALTGFTQLFGTTILTSLLLRVSSTLSLYSWPALVLRTSFG